MKAKIPTDRWADQIVTVGLRTTGWIAVVAGAYALGGLPVAAITVGVFLIILSYHPG